MTDPPRMYVRWWPSAANAVVQPDRQILGKDWFKTWRYLVRGYRL